MCALNERAAAAAFAIFAGVACTPAPAPPSPPIRTTVGMHDVVVRVPDGWVRFDHGHEHDFQRDMNHVMIVDLGPVTREACVREIRHAHGLFRDGRPEDARAHLERLDLRPAFSNAARSEAFERSWRLILDGGLGPRVFREEVETAYIEVFRAIARLEDAPLLSLAERFLPDLDAATHRAIADHHAVVVDGREGLRIDTWDKLSHDHRRSFLFVRNEGNLLAVRMALGRFADLQPAFETLTRSLEIHPRPADAEGPVAVIGS